MGDGFYKAEGEYLLYAPNDVHTPEGSLTREAHARGEYSYPMYGWTWFDNATDAGAALNATILI